MFQILHKKAGNQLSLTTIDHKLISFSMSSIFKTGVIRLGIPHFIKINFRVDINFECDVDFEINTRVKVGRTNSM